jgi:hypothetical protein
MPRRKEAMMAATRLSLFAVAFSAGTFGMVVAASAQNYPWCAQYTDDFGGSMNCGFVSFDQCMETVRGMGGFCIVNNTYQPPHGTAPAGRHKHHAAKNAAKNS